MRFEEVVVFTCGLMDDPTALIHHICNKFNEMNKRYLGLYRVQDEEKEKELKHLGKTAVNLDFFRLVWAESRIPLPGTPLQNPYFNWFDHDKDDQRGLVRDISPVYIPSEYYSFQNLEETLPLKTIKSDQLRQCTLVIDDIHPDVVDSLLSTCSVISKHQSLVNLRLMQLHMMRNSTEDVFKLSPTAQSVFINECTIQSDMLIFLIQQISNCPTMKSVQFRNIALEEPGKLSTYLSEAIRKWGNEPQLEHLRITNCSLLSNQFTDVLQSLSLCNRLTNLSLSFNTVGNAGKHLAESIRSWGPIPPLQSLRLESCRLHEDDCADILQSLLACCNLKEINLSGNVIGKAARHLAEVIKKLSGYGKLNSLCLSDCSFPEDQCAAIMESLSLCKQLTFLDLSSNRIVNAGKHCAECIKKWGPNPPLGALHLDNYRLHEDDCAELLQSLLVCRNLDGVKFAGNIIGNAGSNLGKMIKNCGRLWFLDLRNCSIPELLWVEILKSLVMCKNLVTVKLSFNTLRQSGYQLAYSLRQWGNNSALKILELSGCSIPQDACCELISALSTCTSLIYLKLAGNHLCENGLHLKRYLETITDTLYTLCLGGCSIPFDVSGQIISVLSHCKNLYHMSLPGNTLTGQFSQFVPHRHLRHLDLSDTALNTDDIDHLAAIIRSSKVQSLRTLYLNGNSLDKLEEKTKTLLETCMKHHTNKLTVFLYRNNLTQEFQEDWTSRCEGTKIKLDFDTDSEYKTFK